jgi:hypothetical protein
MCVVCKTTFSLKYIKSTLVSNAAFCISNNNNRTLCPNKFSVSPKDFKKANLSEDICLNGFYLYEEFDDIDEIDVFKVQVLLLENWSLFILLYPLI